MKNQIKYRVETVLGRKFSFAFVSLKILIAERERKKLWPSGFPVELV